MSTHNVCHVDRGAVSRSRSDPNPRARAVDGPHAAEPPAEISGQGLRLIRSGAIQWRGCQLMRGYFDAAAPSWSSAGPCGEDRGAAG
jgi:hypothetical protein